MAVTATSNRKSYSGNGATTSFAVDYFTDENDLVVIIRTDATGAEAVQTLTTHYTTTGEGTESGGTVEMVTAPASGETLVILNDPDPTQDLDIRENDSSPAASKETQLDELAMMIQACREELDRCIKFPKTYGSTDIPAPEPVASNYLRWNAAADELENVASIGDVNEYKAGLEDIGSGVATLVVTYSSALAVAAAPVVSIVNTTDSDPLILTPVVTAYSTTGFTVKWSGDTDTANYKLQYFVVEIA